MFLTITLCLLPMMLGAAYIFGYNWAVHESDKIVEKQVKERYSKDYQDLEPVTKLATKIGMLHLERAMKMHMDMESPRDGTNGTNGTQAIGPVAEGSPQKGTQRPDEAR
jgi:hypothetical protein